MGAVVDAHLALKTFVPNAHVGVNVDAKQLQSQFDAVVIATGATWPRDLRIPNREADGIHFAMEYLQVGRCYVMGTLSYAHDFFL